MSDTERDELADLLMSDRVMMNDAMGRDYALVEADVILGSDWLARVKAETAAEALEHAAAAFESGDVAPDDLRDRSADAPKGWTEASIVSAIDNSGPIMGWLRARAADLRVVSDAG